MDCPDRETYDVHQCSKLSSLESCATLHVRVKRISPPTHLLTHPILSLASLALRPCSSTNNIGKEKVVLEAFFTLRHQPALHRHALAQFIKELSHVSQSNSILHSQTCKYAFVAVRDRKREVCDWWTGKVLLPEAVQDGGIVVVDSEDHGPCLQSVAPPITPTVDDRIEVDKSADASSIHRRKRGTVGDGVNRLGVVSNVVSGGAVPNFRDSDEVGGIGNV